MDTIKKQYRSGEQLKDSVSGAKSGKSDNWIFFTAVLVSVLFWILIKLSDPYTVPYSLRINYKSIPKEKRLSFIADSFVNVDVTAPGFEIIKLNLFENMDVLDINLNNFSLMKKEGQEYYVYTDELVEKLAEVINIPKKDVHFSKNTLSFTLTELSEKTLAVTSLVELGFAEQYELYEAPLLSPQLIKVYGPADVLDTLQQIYTDHKLIAEVNSNRDIHIRLHNPLPKLLKLEPEEVSIRLRVEKYTASSLEIPITVPSLKQTIKLFPKTVNVYFKVAQKDYNNVRINQFEVVPDLQNVDIHSAVRLHLVLSKQPSFIRNATLNPADVEFLIIK